MCDEVHGQRHREGEKSYESRGYVLGGSSGALDENTPCEDVVRGDELNKAALDGVLLHFWRF